MQVRQIHVESLLSDDHLDAELTELELFQEFEEQRELRTLTTRRRRPFVEERARWD
jgi:hypothetical protein